MKQMTPFDEMDRLFDQMRRSMLAGPAKAAFGDPNLRIETGEKEHVVVVDAPGFEKEDIDLRFRDGLLTIDATHEMDTESVDEMGTESMTYSRRLDERVRIPGDVLVEDIEADYHNGVLEVRLPVDSTADTSHRIDID